MGDMGAIGGPGLGEVLREWPERTEQLVVSDSFGRPCRYVNYVVALRYLDFCRQLRVVTAGIDSDPVSSPRERSRQLCDIHALLVRDRRQRACLRRNHRDIHRCNSPCKGHTGDYPSRLAHKTLQQRTIRNPDLEFAFGPKRSLLRFRRRCAGYSRGMDGRERLHGMRAMALLALLLIALGLLLTRCPSNRDGMPGQLAQSMEETVGAARSGALTLDLWIQRRSTDELTSVALSDARDEIVKAYKGIADLKAEDPVDVGRQRMLTESMTGIIGQFNAVGATVRGITAGPSAETARDGLRMAADSLESGYR
jgi:hypothetical protein